MDKTKPQSNVMFSVKCPALGKDVVLLREIWEQKITIDHPEVKGKEELVKQTIQNFKSEDDIYQKIENPRKISFQIECADFLPWNKYLRIALRISDYRIVVTSVYPVKSYPQKGVKKYDS